MRSAIQRQHCSVLSAISTSTSAPFKRSKGRQDVFPCSSRRKTSHRARNDRSQERKVPLHDQAVSGEGAGQDAHRWYGFGQSRHVSGLSTSRSFSNHCRPCQWRHDTMRQKTFIGSTVVSMLSTSRRSGMQMDLCDW